MELEKASGAGLAFRLTDQEKRILFQVLQLYPLVPLSHHRISRGKPSERLSESQQLLEESLAEQKRSDRKKLDGLLRDPQRLQRIEGGYRLRLDRPHVEWLLQIANEVRVGSWLRLDSPDPNQGKLPKLKPDTAVYVVAMEASGYLESALLHALNSSDGSGPV